MIKTENGIFYITGGEACYITVADGGLVNLCFGARVEPEDDMRAALSGGCPEYGFSLARGGKAINPSFEVRASEVTTEELECPFPMLRGGKTLAVTLADEKNALELKLFYKPIPRGGIARRFELINYGADVSLSRAVCGGARIAGGAEIVGASGKKRADGKYVFDGTNPAVAAVCGNEAYGFCMICGAPFTVDTDGENISLALEFNDELYTVGRGETFRSPETFMMYSDNGLGGLERAVHDVLRDMLMPERYAGVRRPVYILDGAAKLGDSGVIRDKQVASSRLGADTYMLDIKARLDEKTSARIAEIKDAAGEAGLKLGVRIAVRDGFEKELVALAELGVNAILLAGKILGDTAKAAYEFCIKKYAALGEIAATYPELALLCDGACDLGAGAYCMTVGSTVERGMFDPFPPCATTSRVEWKQRDGELKYKFDTATFGALSYAFDPLTVDALTANAFRAQVYSYQDDAGLVMSGDVYKSERALTVVSKDKSKAYAVCACAERDKNIKFDGLDAHNLYHVREIDRTYSGAALGRYGLPLPQGGGEHVSFVFHIRQVADFE